MSLSGPNWGLTRATLRIKIDFGISSRHSLAETPKMDGENER